MSSNSIIDSSGNVYRFPTSEEGDKKRGGGNTGGENPPGDGELEARVAKLETHVEYMRRDLSEARADLKEIRSDVNSIKNKLSWFAGAAAIVVGVLAWIAKNRFDQVLDILHK